jgi:hypothetical protein
MVLWNEIYNNEWKQQIVLASIPLWKYDANLFPLANASGCLIDYAGSRFLLSIAHASIAVDEWNFEVETLNISDNGEAGTKIQPFSMQFLTEASLLDKTINFTKPKIADFTYKRISKELDSRHDVLFADGRIMTAKRTIFTPKFDRIPSMDKRYGFFGQVRFAGVEGQRIVFDHRLEDNLKYVGKQGHEFVFELPHPYGSHKNYQGCSGAPIIDEDGELIGLVSYGLKTTNCIYATDINRYRAALDIEAGPPLPKPPK